jgi:hypothetical protein
VTPAVVTLTSLIRTLGVGAPFGAGDLGIDLGGGPCGCLGRLGAEELSTLVTALIGLFKFLVGGSCKGSRAGRADQLSRLHSSMYSVNV